MTENDTYTLASASPKVRKFARELGVDINEVTGSERQGRVTENDIKMFVSNRSFQKKELKIEESSATVKTEKVKIEYLHSISNYLIKFRLNNTRIMSLQGSDFKIYINLPR